MTRALSRLGPLLGSGKEAEVFLHDDGVLKLYRLHAAKDAPFREAAILALVAARGLPAPAVSAVGRFGDRWGLVMSHAPGPALAEALAEPSGRADGLDRMAAPCPP
jgi:aminoglycoside phosphotransferase